jgi:hypothetical protein
MDGHGSHFTLELLVYCRSIGLVVVLRPPHTTHILQGEDVVHFAMFKPKYHQAKMVALAAKIFGSRSYKLTAQDLLGVAKEPWEAAFSLTQCQKAWAAIGVCPFTQGVYWDLLEKERASEAKAVKANIDPSLLTVRGMVGVMFNLPTTADGDATAAAPAAGEKRGRESLHSCDLWDLPGGATGDECFNIVKTKTEAREAKITAAKEKKDASKKKAEASRSADLSLGSLIVNLICDSSHVPKLKVDELRAVLNFKAVSIPKGAKKPELVDLVASKLALPTADIPPGMPVIQPPAPAAVAPVSAAAGSSSAVAGPDDAAASDAEPDGDADMSGMEDGSDFDEC